MEWSTQLGLGFAILLALFLSGLPVFASFFLINAIGTLVVIGPAGFGMFANSVFDTATTKPLLTIPFFILLGEILFRSGTMEVLFDSVDKLVGRVRGRQYILVISLSVILGALSGAGMAVAAMLGRSVLPGMVKRGYNKTLSAGVILGGCGLAPIIPPSILVIIIGTLSDTSIAKLLIAGILPGLMLAGLFIVYVQYRIRTHAADAPADVSGEHQNVTPKDLAMAIVRMLPFTVIIFSVMGLILLGIATPTEAAATGVAGAMVAAAVNRRLTVRMLADASLGAAKISAMILVIMVSSKMFTQLLSFTGATSGIINAVSSAGLDPSLMFLLMMLVPFVLCMFIDQIALMLVVIPIFAPLLGSLGFDPVWFWTIFLLNITVGGISPPFGYALFALRGATDLMTTGEVFKAAWPFVGIFLAAIVILYFVPQIATLLPALL
ncbi:MAG: TRAP transporter large permease [Alphaproteobacteria bacterium]|jgi:tripartite ATP-independent transporter DctM subunit|nr:TRAP transporter large permease [Alphaproteobacteria bacterium]MBO6861183.1 TRAP transporter large permease [Alphaproteobacteria bacterium]